MLAVENLTVERGGRVVLSNLGFTLAPGETILVSGRNGAGKSTLLRTIAGLLQPVSGAVRYGFADADTRGVETVHYLGYEDGLKPSLTVGENLEFWAAMLASPLPTQIGPARFGHSRRSKPGKPGLDAGRGKGWGSFMERGPLSLTLTKDPHPYPSPQGGGGPASNVAVVSPADALAAYGIARLIDLPAAYLSAGQKRRVALARLLLAPRPIWLLDEPLIALDTLAQKRAVEIMAAHTAAGGAILVASHQPLATTRSIELDAVVAA